MEITDWILECYYLKNVLDSYGISAILPVQIHEFPDTGVGRILKEIHNKFKNELLINGEENFHITLFPIMNSIFVLPENTERRQLCLEVMTHLQKTITDSIPQKDIQTFHRLTKSYKTSPRQALEFLQQKWEEICSITSFPQMNFLNNPNETDLLNKPYSLKKHTISISPEGSLTLVIKGSLIKKEDIIRLCKYLNIKTRTLSFHFHISLAQVRTPYAYIYLKNHIRECEQNGKLIISVKAPEIVMYKHRSLSFVIQRRHLNILSEAENYV